MGLQPSTRKNAAGVDKACDGASTVDQYPTMPEKLADKARDA